MRVVLHPLAERDVDEAAGFYLREGSPALAARFVREFRRTMALLAQQPQIGTARSQGRRGLTMNVFPYTVIYRADGAEIVVLVVKHDRRHPGFGGRRS